MCKLPAILYGDAVEAQAVLTGGAPVLTGKIARTNIRCSGVIGPLSSRGQDTWFSATGPGFESPYRYHPRSIPERAAQGRPSFAHQLDDTCV